jgi:hypothetical protein
MSRTAEWNFGHPASGPDPEGAEAARSMDAITRARISASQANLEGRGGSFLGLGSEEGRALVENGAEGIVWIDEEVNGAD